MTALDLFGPTQVAGGVTVRPSETRAFTPTDTFFRDCSSAELDDGTQFSAAWFNQMLAVLRALARSNGQTVAAADIVTPDNGDDAVLIKAIQHLIQRGQTNYAPDTGTANSVVVSLTPTPSELKSGLVVRFKKGANSNTAATTLTLNAFTPKPIKRVNGTDVAQDDLSANMPYEALYDLALDVFVLTNFAGALPSNRLTANRTIYVNQAIGSDANDGVSNTAGHALATIQAGVMLAFNYAPSQYVITVFVAAGTYNEVVSTPGYQGPNLIIEGASTASVIVSSGNNHCITVSGPNTMTVKNVTVQNTGPSLGGGFVSASGATMTMVNTASNAISGGVFYASTSSSLRPGNHTFKGNSYALYYASGGANIALDGGQVQTIANPITLGAGTALVTTLGLVGASGVAPPTFVNPGNVTGNRFLGNLNGIIGSGGLGVNFFPGTVAGSVSLGAQYNP